MCSSCTPRPRRNTARKSGAPTNYYITLSPEPVLQSNAEIEDVEIVVSPDHKVFSHTNPLRGLVEGGTFILQSQHDPLQVWKDIPLAARKTIRDKKIKFFVLDGFKVAKPHAPTPELETRMMGIAFIGAICGHVDRIVGGATHEACWKKIRQDLTQEVRRQGRAVVEGNLTVIKEAFAATSKVDYDAGGIRRSRQDPGQRRRPDQRHLGVDVPPDPPRFDLQLPRRRILRRRRRQAVPRRHDQRSAGDARHRHVHAVRQRRQQGQGPVPAPSAGIQARPLHRLHGMHAGLPRCGDPQHGSRHPRPA
jgi:Pyruvate/2-oxoacid:ferredoxin oxidoreductase gamma subunit